MSEQPENKPVDKPPKSVKKIYVNVEREERAHKARKFGRTIWTIFVTAIFLAIAFFTVMGILDMQRLNEDKEPLWYIDQTTEEIEGGMRTKYNVGLYVINKDVTSTEKTIILKPFFIP